MLKYLSQGFASFAFRRALRCACALFLALIFSAFVSSAHTFWLAVVAALLMQTEVGFPIQHGLQRFFWILILFLIGSQAGMGLHLVGGLSLAIILVMTVTAYYYALQARRYLGLHFSLLSLIVLLLTLLFPMPLLNPASLVDIFIGATLGLSANLLLFPDQADQEFPKRVTPLLHDLSGYLRALVELMLREPGAAAAAEYQRDHIEQYWANKNETFPVWVFETGFNPELKPGQYFFAVHLGRVTEILFALHHFARHAFPADLLQEFAPVIRDSSARSQELLANLGMLLEGKTPTVSKTDFIADQNLLDERFQSKIKLSLELLDISKDYVYLAAFIRYLKDLRLQLLQLAATLSG